MSSSASRDLKRNRAIATGMLFGMSAVFVATLFVPSPPTWVRFVQAVAEAGMIGGLADWFAVEALFRHPLRIPIPHTALLPKSKNRVARNVGNFITKHFLKPDLIREKLQDTNIAALLKDWILVPGNAHMLATKAGDVIKSNLTDSGPSAAPSFFKVMLRNLLMRPKLELFIRKMIGQLMASDLRNEMTHYALTSVRSLLDDNRDSIEKIVQDRSRWWIASAADRRLSEMLINEMIRVVDDLSQPNAPLRQKLDTALTGFATDPDQSANISKTVQNLLVQLVDSDEFDAIVATFIRGLKRSLEEDLNTDSGGHTVHFIETTLVSLAKRLDANPDELRAVNDELAAAAGELADRLSGTASQFIATTIQTWDETEMVALFEDQVGSDLQFIRMNGTMLGGLIGGVLFFLSEFIHRLI